MLILQLYNGSSRHAIPNQGSDVLLRGLLQGNALDSFSTAGALCARTYSLTLLIIAFDYCLYNIKSFPFL
jgi:hypothetical protein